MRILEVMYYTVNTKEEFERVKSNGVVVGNKDRVEPLKSIILTVKPVPGYAVFKVINPNLFALRKTDNENEWRYVRDIEVNELEVIDEVV